MTFHHRRIGASVGVIALGIVATRCAENEPNSQIATTTQKVTVRAECLGDSDADGGDVWTCDEERIVECQEQSAPGGEEVLHVDVPACETGGLTVDPGPYGLGSHDISVFGVSASEDAGPPDASPTDASPGDANASDARDSGGPVCAARLTIVDTTPPALETHDGELWPPNHKMRTFTVDDCVTATDACDDGIDVRFVWATVDEFSDARGSGHTEPDLAFSDCRTVELRAERQGGGDGRVYELGVRATDGSGNSVDGTCRIVVPHDQSGQHPAAGAAVSEIQAPADCN